MIFTLFVALPPKVMFPAARRHIIKMMVYELKEEEVKDSQGCCYHVVLSSVFLSWEFGGLWAVKNLKMAGFCRQTLIFLDLIYLNLTSFRSTINK